MTASDPVENLLFQTSPFGNLDALVESDGSAVYFYLASHPSAPADRFATKACWVRNLKPGPLVINQNDLAEGRPPLLPRTHARSTTGNPPPQPEDLRVVWFEEGNGAALFEKQQLLAVIPPWSGMEGFHGYAAECVAASPVCWPLPAGATDPLIKRLARASQFWDSFHPESDTNLFKQLQSDLVSRCESVFGSMEEYFAIDGGTFPPKGLGLFRNDTGVTLVTLGMSLCPQPNVEMHVDHPGLARRVELAARFPAKSDRATLDAWLAQMAATSAYPWQHWTWLGQGHTLPWLPGTFVDQRPADVAWLASEDWLREALPKRPRDWQMPDFRDDPVQLLWLVPITAAAQRDLGTRPGPPPDWSAGWSDQR